jgi:hypothetical protein
MRCAAIGKKGNMDRVPFKAFARNEAAAAKCFVIGMRSDHECCCDRFEIIICGSDMENKPNHAMNTMPPEPLSRLPFAEAKRENGEDDS